MADARFFHGWVKELTASAVVVSFSDASSLEPGQSFMFHLYGRTSDAVFAAELTMVSGEDALFSIHQSMRLLTPSEEARVFVGDVEGSLQGDLLDIDIIILDISRRGAGILAPIPVSAGERVRLEVDTPTGTVTCYGEVRYCKPDSRVFGHYRAGLRLEEMDRIEKARWLNVWQRNAA